MYDTDIRKAQALVDTQQLDAARSLLQSIVRTYPQQAEGWYLLGVTEGTLGRFPEAGAAFERLIAIAPQSSDAHYNLALALERQHRDARAAAHYRQCLALNPGHYLAHNNLGLLCLRAGAAGDAVTHFQEAIRLAPDQPGLYLSLAVALADLQRYTEAIDHCRRLLAADPDLAPAHELLGTLHHKLGDRLQAEASFRSALRLDPNGPSAHLGLAEVLRETQRPEEAIAHYRHAKEDNPTNPLIWHGLGLAYVETRRIADAIACYRHALALEPRNASLLNDLGVACTRQGRYGEAADCYQQALALDPTLAAAHSNLGDIHARRGDGVLALQCYQRALTLEPDMAAAHSNLGVTLVKLRRYTEAFRHFEISLSLRPNVPATLSAYAGAIASQGDTPRAIALLRQALALDPDYVNAHSSLLWFLNYTLDDPAELLREHALWGKHWSDLAGDTATRATPYAHSEHSTLRIGYVSPDFREHPITFFVEPILTHHGRDVEIFCYSDAPRADAFTQRLQALVPQWRIIFGQSHQEVIEQIRGDGIDILVDLAGHSENNRLEVFAHRPAPVQVSYLGYPATTGLPAIDYYITDAIADPAPEYDQYYVEKLIRLPHGFSTYQPPREAPAVMPLPGQHTGQITFGSLNNLAKIGADVIELWSRILATLPTVRLVLQSPAFEAESTLARLTQAFAQQGIDAARLELLPSMDLARHLDLYQRIDVALDTFPWCGHTTTCHALWMGVPVITLYGHTHAGRMAASVLHQIGLPELIAQSKEEYLDKAVALAQDLARLSALRRTMRERMLASPLCDGKSFTRDLEAAYRGMRKPRCSTKS